MGGFILKINKICSGWCGSVDWVPTCKSKGCWFDSRSGHIPGLWARSSVGGVQEATNQCISPTSVLLSLLFSLPSLLSKNKIFKIVYTQWCLTFICLILTHLHVCVQAHAQSLRSVKTWLTCTNEHATFKSKSEIYKAWIIKVFGITNV